MKSQVKIIGAMLIWGSIGVFVRYINLPSIQIAFLRAVIASLFLGGIGLYIRDKISMSSIKDNIVLLLSSGAIIGLNWFFLFQAYKYTTISNATMSYYFAPVFVILLSPIVLKEKLTLSKLFFVFIAMMGLFFILKGDAGQANTTYHHIKGIIYGLLGAASYASVVLMNKFIKNLSGFETTIIQLFASTLVLLPVILYQNNFHIFEINTSSWFFIIILGIIHTGIAYLLYLSSIKDLKGQSIAILSYIDPISAVIMASLFLGENMNFYQIIGGILVLGSTLLSEKENALSFKFNLFQRQG